MSKASIEATILVQEALILALISTHQAPQKVIEKFAATCTGMVKNIRQREPNNEQLAVDFTAEWERLVKDIKLKIGLS
jgi:hypothetical protein